MDEFKESILTELQERLNITDIQFNGTAGSGKSFLYIATEYSSFYDYTHQVQHRIWSIFLSLSLSHLAYLFLYPFPSSLHLFFSFVFCYHFFLYSCLLSMFWYRIKKKKDWYIFIHPFLSLSLSLCLSLSFSLFSLLIWIYLIPMFSFHLDFLPSSSHVSKLLKAHQRV